MSSENKVDDGGPAFPFDEYTKDGEQYKVHLGMSLRDWFAGQALAGCDWVNRQTPFEADAKQCYQIADAMIEARNK